MELAEREKIFEQIIENNWVAVVYADLTGTVTYANPAAYELYGYEPGELIGLNVDVFNAQVSHDTSNIVQDIIDKGGWSGELIQQRKNGNTFNALLTVWLLHNSKGEPVGYASNSKDITATKATDESLKHAQFSLDNAAVSIFWLRDDGSFTYVNDNACQSLGYTRGELLSMNVQDIDPYCKEHGFAIDWNGEEGEESHKIIESTHQKKSGQVFPVEISLNQMHYQGRKYVHAFAHDITERKRAQQEIMIQNSELESANREIKVLFREMHHRVKNNLQIIASLLRLQSAYISDDQLLEVFTESQNRLQSMSLIHESLYQYDKLSNINVRNYLGQLIEKLINVYDLNEIDFDINMEETEFNIEVMVSFGLMMNELISNSLKHAFPHGEGAINIEIKEDETTDSIYVNYMDNGVGMPQNGALVEPNTLGLELINSLVDQLNGTIQMPTVEHGVHYAIQFKA